ncbi:MAG: phosphoadenylyl-sulfate reductase [Bacteroidales bacterium]|jgi:phosphoadenosine phosphosulfate reductase|nr:phosphoadenylyl-sulfate reductase [Bacteroidales bacterium]
MEGDLKLSGLRSLLKGKTIEESLKIIAGHYPGKVVFTTSFGIEDQVITHLIFSNNIPIEVITLDTGRLFNETYRAFSETIIKYNKKINVYFPDHEAVGKMMTEKGPYSFYESKENRLECCRLRKVVPLNRAMTGKKIWISGIRATQSENRLQMEDLEYDDDKKLIKYYPLFKWSIEEVEKFIRKNEIPYNALYDKGYVSIGCEPCTRPIIRGQDFRAGRWWWEDSDKKECGLHHK